MTVPMVAADQLDLHKGRSDLVFASGIVVILVVFFLPIPSVLVDLGIAFSIALSVLILMVSLWIQKPLEFTAFPTILLLSTILRLSLNIASTRLILTHGSEGITAAGHVIGGFSQLIMGGDFVIGLIVFAILITVNFLVITKGATRIAEVGARFTLDAIPGKQMAIDADLSAGSIDEKEAQRRRRELEEESSFFGSMDGASKFVRGDAIAGMIILAVNILGGIVIGVTRHGMSLASAADIYVKLSVGDAIVAQIPALIVSLAAGLLVSKGGTRGPAEKAVFGQLGAYPSAAMVSGLAMGLLAFVPGLPFGPFAILGATLGFVGVGVARNTQEVAARDAAAALALEAPDEDTDVRALLRAPEVELCLSRQLSARLLTSRGEMAGRVAKMRRKFAKRFGFVVPEIRLTDDLALPAKGYEIKIYGSVVARGELRPTEVLVIPGADEWPKVPGEQTIEPAFGLKAIWVADSLQTELRNQGFSPIEPLSVLLTHLSETIGNSLPQLFSYKDLRALTDNLEPAYRKLLDEICPGQISFSGLQAVLKLLLAERVSIRNVPLILEAVAEVAPLSRRAEQIAEHVRHRLAQQICADIAEGGNLKVIRLGQRWDLAFHQSLKRDSKGEIIEFDFDPRMVELFGTEAGTAIRAQIDRGNNVAIVTAPEARPYVRLIVERLFPNVPILSSLEISRGVVVESLGSIS